MTRYRPTRIRYRSSPPASFWQPGGRGSSASELMPATMRLRSFFWSMASISLAADGLIRTLYLATPLQSLHELLEVQVRLPPPFLERGEILRVLRQRQLHGLVDH